MVMRPNATIGCFVLADLVALGQVGIEVILAREHRARRDVASMARPKRTAMAGLFVDTGSTPGRPRSMAQAWVFGSAP
jgi:hypothetical protein